MAWVLLEAGSSGLRMDLQSDVCCADRVTCTFYCFAKYFYDETLVL